MNRREFITIIGAATAGWPLVAGAQQSAPAGAPVVGVLRIDTHDDEPVALLRQELAKLGRIDGRNLHIDIRLDDGRQQQFQDHVAALVQKRASVIVTFGDSATRAAQRGTTTISIVALGNDLVGAGLISSLARPGGNTTGVSIFSSELDLKVLELGKELLPTARRFAQLRDPDAPTAQQQATTEAAKALGLELMTVDARTPVDIAPAFATLRSDGAEAVTVLSSPLFYAHHREIGALSLSNKLPAICQFREMVVAGCLASYGTRRSDVYALLAALTDKMLKGASPDETPAQQPTSFELVVNRRAARVLGIDIPASILARADEVIE
jgi:putative ABC transport system substrate-binding protein